MKNRRPAKAGKRSQTSSGQGNNTRSKRGSSEMRSKTRKGSYTKSSSREGGDSVPQRPRRSKAERFDKKERFSDKKRSTTSGNRRSFGQSKPYDEDTTKKPRRTKPERFSDKKRPTTSGNRRSFGQSKPFDEDDTKKPRRTKPERFSSNRNSTTSEGKRSIEKSNSFDDEATNRPQRKRSIRPSEKKVTGKRSPYPSDASEEGGKPQRTRSGNQRKSVDDRKFKSTKTSYSDRKRSEKESSDQLEVSSQIRLNKFISNSGVCSRREADELILMGLITVNGKSVTELGYKVSPGDQVKYNGKLLTAEKNTYILLNKPKGYITTTKDPQERKTVMHLLGTQVKERVYPVGRLDRNTTGLLLLTNDGDLAERLSHPSYRAKKVYRVELSTPITNNDFDKIVSGVSLEEGKAQVDDLAIVSPDRKIVGMELHIGWNRVVRRIFEALGYEVIKLDRTVYAGLDKKDLPRGEWRFLTDKEVIKLKHFQK